MAEEKVKKRNIKRYGFIVGPASSSGEILKVMLVNFMSGRGYWYCYMPRSPQESRYYHYLFILSCLFCEQHYVAAQAINDFGTEKFSFPLYAGNNDSQYRYDRMVSYYMDVRGKIDKDGTAKKYKKIPVPLRYGFENIFKIVYDEKSRKKARIEPGKSANPQNIYFWYLEDFKLEIRKHLSSEKIKLLEEDIPKSSIAGTDLVELRKRLCTEQQWKNWHHEKVSKSCKQKYDVNRKVDHPGIDNFVRPETIDDSRSKGLGTKGHIRNEYSEVIEKTHRSAYKKYRETMLSTVLKLERSADDLPLQIGCVGEPLDDATARELLTARLDEG